MTLKFYVKVAASAKLGKCSTREIIVEILGVNGSIISCLYFSSFQVAGSDAALTGVQVKLTDGDFNASLVESNIGSFDFTKMNMGLKILVGEGLLALGKFLDSAPLIIPAVPSIKFSDTSLVIGNDFIKVESDILYS